MGSREERNDTLSPKATQVVAHSTGAVTRLSGVVQRTHAFAKGPIGESDRPPIERVAGRLSRFALPASIQAVDCELWTVDARLRQLLPLDPISSV